jgi:hypothetical protein
MMNTVTAQQKIKWLIVSLTNLWGELPPLPYPCENIDALYEELVDKDEHWDAKNDVREGTCLTDIACDDSRHYEAKSVAHQLPDGSWVGWTYWYGGGKHGQPEAIDWISDAYDLSCEEHEKIVVVRNFKK